MACDPDVLKQVPLFATLDDEEMAILASQVEIKTFAPRQRIYKMGATAERAYVHGVGERARHHGRRR